MLRFIYIGDIHYSESDPYYRIDNYKETRKQKIQEIKKYTKQYPVTAILEGGDFFDHPKIAAQCLSEIFTEWEKNIRLKPDSFGSIPLIGIEGNHELIGSQINSYDKTSLHLLEACGFLEIASKKNPIIFTDKSGFTVAITGSPYDKNSDKLDDKSAYIVEDKAGDIHIHLTHGLIMNKSFGRKFAHTTIHELAPYTKADITINGHDHIGFPTEQIDDKWFVNPGSLMRMKAENNEISRMPKFLVIEIHDDLSIHLKDVYFKCAKPGSDVLSTDHLELKKHRTNHLAQIQALVNQAETKTGLHISDIIDNVGNTNGIDKEIVTEAKEAIVEAMDAMETPYNPEGEYFIEKIELKNFLSHKKSSFDFTNGLNILAGESRSGKSAVLRAITEVYQCNLVQPRDAITFNEDYFKISLTLSNGYIITRRVEKKERGFNGYEIYNPKTGEIEEYNTKALPMIQELLGMREIRLSDKDKDNVNINFLPQDAGWFYSNMSGPNRAKLLGTIYGTNYADLAIRNYNSQIKKKNEEVKTHKKDLEKYEESKKDYVKLPDLEISIKDAEDKIKELESLSQKIEKVQALLAEIKSLTKAISEKTILIKTLSISVDDKYQVLLKESARVEQSKKLIGDLNKITQDGKTARFLVQKLTPLEKLDLSELEKEQEALKVAKQKYETFVKLQKTLTETQKQLQLVQNRVKQLENIKETEDKFQKLKELDEQLRKAKVIIKDLTAILEQGNLKKKTVQSLNKLEEAEKQLSALQKNKDTIAAGTDLVKETKVIQAKLKQASQTVETQKKNISAQTQNYRKKLTETNSCPICQTQISQNTIEKIIKGL